MQKAYVCLVSALVGAAIGVGTFWSMLCLSPTFSNLSCRSLSVVDSKGASRISMSLDQGEPKILLSSADNKLKLLMRIAQQSEPAKERRIEINLLDKDESACYITHIDSGITSLSLGRSGEGSSLNMASTSLSNGKRFSYITLGHEPGIALGSSPRNTYVEFSGPQLTCKLNHDGSVLSRIIKRLGSEADEKLTIAK